MKPRLAGSSTRTFFTLDFILTLLLLSLNASAGFVNITVDDTLGNQVTGDRIVYEPLDLWNLGQNCPNCTAKPDPSKIYYGTWHDGTFFATLNQLLTATLSFEGVAVYVYCLTTRSSSRVVGDTDMTFYIDGEIVGQYVQLPNGDPTWNYNVPVYINESLSSGPHTLVLVNGVVGEPNDTLTLLDYIVYTKGQTTSSSSRDGSPPITNSVPGSSTQIHFQTPEQTSSAVSMNTSTPHSSESNGMNTTLLGATSLSPSIPLPSNLSQGSSFIPSGIASATLSSLGPSASADNAATSSSSTRTIIISIASSVCAVLLVIALAVLALRLRKTVRRRNGRVQSQEEGPVLQTRECVQYQQAVTMSSTSESRHEEGEREGSQPSIVGRNEAEGSRFGTNPDSAQLSELGDTKQLGEASIMDSPTTHTRVTYDDEHGLDSLDGEADNSSPPS